MRVLTHDGRYLDLATNITYQNKSAAAGPASQKQKSVALPPPRASPGPTFVFD